MRGIYPRPQWDGVEQDGDKDLLLTAVILFL